MGQEFVIKSTTLEDKINQLLPSQGGAQAGVDLSASTTIIPIIDLTESAEGSGLRQDLQSSFSLSSITEFSVNNTTTTLVNTTGYYRVFLNIHVVSGGFGEIRLTDGTTTKDIAQFTGSGSGLADYIMDFIVLLQAGESLVALAANANITLTGNTRQLADLSGNLVNP